MRKFLFKNFSLVITAAFLVMLVVPFVVSSQGTGNPTSGTGNSSKPQDVLIKIDNPFKSNSIEGLMRAIVNDILIPIGSVVAVLMVMYAGFLFVTARGDTSQIKKAKEALLYAVIGAAVLLGAWVITEAIQGTIKELRK